MKSKLAGLVNKAKKAAHGLSSRRNFHALKAGVGVAMGHEIALRTMDWRTVVDIGANKGQFALAVLDIQPSAVIHSFEPLSAPLKIFNLVFKDDPNVIGHPYAIGPQSAEASMHVAGLDHSSSLLPIGDEQQRLFPETKEAGRESVQVRAMDQVLKPQNILGPALLKMDVQGFEYEALKGCESLLSHFDAVYVECSYRELYVGQKLAGDIIIWLAERGFRIADVLGTYRDAKGRAVQSDFLFLR